eukprot:UN01757
MLKRLNKNKLVQLGGKERIEPQPFPSEIEADVFVFCTGPQTDNVLKFPGIIFPLKGYSLTLPNQNKHFTSDNFKKFVYIFSRNIYI